MDDNSRLGIALAAPVVLLAGGAMASLQTPAAATAAVAPEEEVLDPEVEKILYPYRAAQRAKEQAEVDRILYPYRTQPTKTRPKQIVNTVASKPDEAATTEAVAKAPIESIASTSFAGDTSDLEALLNSGDTAADDATTGSGVSAEPAPATAPTTSTASSFALNAPLKSEPSDPAPTLVPPPGTSPAMEAPTEVESASAPPASSIASSIDSASEIVLTSGENTDTSLADASTAIATSSVEEPSEASASKPATPPFLGVGIRDVNGTIVTTIYEGSTAEKLGIILGDELMTFAGIPLTDMESLRTAIKPIRAGEDIVLTIKRNGTQYELGPIAIGTRTKP